MRLTHQIRQSAANSANYSKRISTKNKSYGMGYDITPLIISRIEKNQRHVCDAELLVFSQALNISMEWLCGEEN